jgi:hypothetical protein
MIAVEKREQNVDVEQRSTHSGSFLAKLVNQAVSNRGPALR